MPGSQPLLSQGLATRQLRPETTAQFCPYCLRQAAYHRLAWLLVAVSACSEHHCLLADRCPGCYQPLSIRAVVDGVCPRCQANLTEAETKPLDPDSLLAQQAIHAWLGAGPQLGEMYGSPHHSPRILFRVLDGLRLSLMSHSPTRHNFERLATLPVFRKGQKLTSPQSLALYTTAFDALRDWPHGFHTFLNRFAHGSTGNSLFRHFGYLYAQWLQYRWQSPVYHFIQHAFDDHVTHYLTHSTTVRRAERYQRQEVSLVTKRYHTLSQTVAQLGVSKDVVLAMVRFGLLTAGAGPEVDGSQQWLITRTSVTELREHLAAVVSPPAPNYTVELTDAARLLAVVGLSAAGIVALVLNGQLPATWDHPTLRHLRFEESDIRAEVAAIKQRNGWLSRAEVAARLGVKVTVITKWVQAGLLTPATSHANAQHFEQATIEQFAKDHIFSDEAAQILEVGLDVVQKWARKGRLAPVAGGEGGDSHRYLFRRAEVEQLRPENRLSGPQLARQLGLSRSQLFQWIKQGKVQPISGPGIDGCQHYLFVLNS